MTQNAPHALLVTRVQLRVESRAGERSQITAARQCVQHTQQGDHTVQSGGRRQCLQALSDVASRLAGHLQSAAGPLQQLDHPGHLRPGQKLAPQKVLTKTQHDRMHGSVPHFILLPDMRHFRTDEHQVSVTQWSNAVPHNAIAVAANRQGDLHLRMEMPARAVVPPVDDLAIKRFVLVAGDLFEDGLG